MEPDILRRARESGMTQIDVSALLDVSPSTVVRMYGGQRELKASELVKLTKEIRRRAERVTEGLPSIEALG